MKRLFLSALISFLCTSPLTQAAEHEQEREGLDSSTRFIFYSVLEGLYNDGVSTEDTNQILLKREGEGYFHFIYACPICSPTIYALETYRSRPEFYGRKDGASNFGPGLSKEMQDRLYDENPKVRLSAINELVHKWISGRMDQMNLSADARTALERELAEKRKQGERMLKSFQSQNWISAYAPAFAELNECAACNGAVGKPMKP